MIEDMKLFEVVGERALAAFDKLMGLWWNWRAKRNGWIVIANSRDWDKPARATPPALPSGTAELPDASMAECVVLGAMLEKPETIRPTLAKLNGENPFHDERARILFDVIRELSQSGAHIDYPTICLHFEKHVRSITKNPEISARFLAWASSLPEKSLADGELFEFHLRDVLDAHVKRRLLAMMDEARGALGDVPAGHVLAGLIDAGRYLQRQIPSSMPAIDAAELVGNPPAEPPVLVGGLLHKGNTMMIGGASKSCKTWTLLDLAVSVAFGVDWLGLTIAEPTPVLVLSPELPDWALAARFSGIAEAKGVELKPGRVSVMPLRGSTKSLDQLLPDILSMVWQSKAGLVIIDSLYRFFGDGVDERAQIDVFRIMKSIERLATEGECAVAYAAHYAKGNVAERDTIDRVSGSGVFGRAPDALLMLTKHELQDHYTVETVVRFFPQIEPFVVQWAFPLMRRQPGLDPTKLRRPGGGRKPEHDPRTFLQILVDAGPSSLSSWAEQCGVARKTLVYHVQQMRAAGWIETVGEGAASKQKITERGLQVLKNFGGKNEHHD